MSDLDIFSLELYLLVHLPDVQRPLLALAVMAQAVRDALHESLRDVLREAASADNTAMNQSNLGLSNTVMRTC